MSLTKAQVRKCRDCGSTAPLSTRLLCPECGQKRFISCMHQLRAKEGPYYDRWLAGMRAALEVEAEA